MEWCLPRTGEGALGSYCLAEGALGSYCLAGTEGQFCKMKRVLQMGGSAARLHSKVSILNATQNPSRVPHPPRPPCTLTVGAQRGGSDTSHCGVSLSPESPPGPLPLQDQPLSLDKHHLLDASGQTRLGPVTLSQLLRLISYNPFSVMLKFVSTVEFSYFSCFSRN